MPEGPNLPRGPTACTASHCRRWDRVRTGRGGRIGKGLARALQEGEQAGQSRGAGRSLPEGGQSSDEGVRDEQRGGTGRPPRCSCLLAPLKSDTHSDTCGATTHGERCALLSCVSRARGACHTKSRTRRRCFVCRPKTESSLAGARPCYTLTVIPFSSPPSPPRTLPSLTIQNPVPTHTTYQPLLHGAAAP
jgi:hypothetical protein